MNALETAIKKLNINENDFEYQYISVFKNPSNLPINQIHLERCWYEFKNDLPRGDILNDSLDDDGRKKIFECKKEIIPALDKRWLPKLIFYQYEPYNFTLSIEENMDFIIKNILYIESLEYFLKCNFHQFWCTILFEPSAAVSLRSFILNPIPPYQIGYLGKDYSALYITISSMVLEVYQRLITFKVSRTEYMSKEYCYDKLIEKKLLNLPIVNTLALIYKDKNLDFVNNLMSAYFENTLQLDFIYKEVEDNINQTLLILNMIKSHVCGFNEGAVIVPIAIEPRPAVFSLSWIFSVVDYLLHTMSLLNILLQFYKPAIEICIKKDLPFGLPAFYVNIYQNLYELIGERDELEIQKDLSEQIFDEINIGRSEFIDAYHMFVTFCLDKTLESMGDDKKQEHLVELYLKFMTTALDEEYFICDYNIKYNISNQNEMFESCTLIDSTRTGFITSCINKLNRQKTLQKMSDLKKETIENVFKRFKPLELEIPKEPVCDLPSKQKLDENVIEQKIKYILDVLPHLGDGFALKCLETYNFNHDDVINAILEENLPPHLYEIPFDSIRIPPEPEPEKPVLAYQGKKPEYDDALKLLNDKKDMNIIKSFVLEGVQYSNDYLYDDEYDDRDDDDVPIKVADNRLEKDLLNYNPNYREVVSDSSESEDDENTKRNGDPSTSNDPKNKLNFCEDPAVLRERREAKFKHQHPPQKNPHPKGNVVGKPKGQGQDKDVLKARDKKNVNKSVRANHNRKGGAQWKRNRGMIPM